MKTIFFRSGFIVAFIVFLWGCNKYYINTQILVPADITITQDIQRVGVLNRSLPERGSMFQNILEGFLSGESILADREGSNNCVRSVANHLNKNPRFRAVLIDEDYRGTGTKQFPIPLDWSEVDKLCKRYQVDGLLVLETFDSDILFVTGSRDKVRRENNREIPYKEFYADLAIRVNAGWRFYDNVNKRMIDQQVFTDEKAWSAVGLTPEEVMRKLPHKRAAINEAAIFAGKMMAFRISPKWIPVTRAVYTRGGKYDNFKKVKYATRVKDWNEIIFQMDAPSKLQNRKIAARACYNTAIAYEMLGDLHNSYQWAKKAYSLHPKSIYQDYVNEIYLRIMEQHKLEEQLPGD